MLRAESQGSEPDVWLSGSGLSALSSPKRVRGIEPPPKAWEAFILPLNYTRKRPRHSDPISNLDPGKPGCKSKGIGDPPWRNGRDGEIRRGEPSSPPGVIPEPSEIQSYLCAQRLFPCG